MKRKFRKADNTVVEYGSQLGDFLRAQIADIAAKEAGEGGDADAAQQAITEEMAKECGLSAEEFAQILAGTLDPDETKCAAIAAVLSKHGVDVTGDHVMELVKADAEKSDDDAAQEEAEAVTEQALAAAQHEATEMRAKFGETETAFSALRETHAALVAQVAKDAPLVEAGRAALQARRDDILKRVALRGTVTPAFKATVDSASAEQLDALSSAFGLDPLADPMCAACGKAKAAEYRSSQPAADDNGAPKRVTPIRAPGAKPTDDDRMDAARAYAATKELSLADAIRAVKPMTDDAIFTLADEFAAGASST